MLSHLNTSSGAGSEVVVIMSGVHADSRRPERQTAGIRDLFSLIPTKPLHASQPEYPNKDLHMRGTATSDKTETPCALRHVTRKRPQGG